MGQRKGTRDVPCKCHIESRGFLELSQRQAKGEQTMSVEGRRVLDAENDSPQERPPDAFVGSGDAGDGANRQIPKAHQTECVHGRQRLPT